MIRTAHFHAEFKVERVLDVRSQALRRTLGETPIGFMRGDRPAGTDRSKQSLRGEVALGDDLLSEGGRGPEVLPSR